MVLGWGRLFFLKNLAKFGSNASKSIHIQDHINQQVSLIEKFKPETLNEINQTQGLDSACSKISSELPSQSNNKFLNNFSNRSNSFFFNCNSFVAIEICCCKIEILLYC